MKYISRFRLLAFYKTFILLIIMLTVGYTNMIAQPIRVVVAGLNHDHVHGILRQYNNGKVDIIGIADPDKKLWAKYSKLYNLPDSLFYSSLKEVLAVKKPDAVLGYNPAADHLSIIQICAPLGISVMVEKPLAATLQQAQQMQALAVKYKISVLTNYETTWYASYHDIYNTINADSIGQIKKIVVHDGHQGPKEIGCSQEFLKWLTDPAMNGAGALNDFGCYGADLMTWLMKGARPVAVTAVTRHYKPTVYPNVDDDATIIVEYAGATGLIEASWNWPFSIKDMEVFGETGYLHGLDGNNIVSRMRENRKGAKVVAPLEAPMNDAIIYLAAVLRKQITGENDLSSLNYNMIVMEILDAAKRSAASGKRVSL